MIGKSSSRLYKIGGMATLIMLVIMSIQVIIFVTWPPPSAVTDWFVLLQNNWLLGLLSLDLLYLLTNALLIPLYLALYAALKRASESWMLIALTLGLVGITAYFSSNTAFEMLSLSNEYAVAKSEAEKSLALAAGQAMLAIYKGTAFDVYYILNAAFLLIVSPVMLRSSVFSKGSAYAGMLSGVLMLVPSTVETIGPIFALASLVPWTIFSVLVARRLFLIGGVTSANRAQLFPETA